MDEGCLVIQLGSEAPTMCMDNNGHLMLCENGDLRTAILQKLQVKEEQMVEVSYKDLPSTEIFPQSVAYNSNGRFILLCGDGEYMILTSRNASNKSYGNAMEAVWSTDKNGDYATKEVVFSTESDV